MLSSGLFSSFDYRLASCNSSKEIAQSRKWFDIRSMLIPDWHHENTADDDKSLCHALKLCASCEYPDAKLLTTLLGNVKTLAEARACLADQEDHDPRLLCFAALFSNPVDMARLRKASDAGNSFAQVRLAKLSSGVEQRLALATLSANQGDREACDLLAHFYETGRVVCSSPMLFYLRWAAYLHDEFALGKMCGKLDYLDPESWFWKGHRAGFGWDPSYFASHRNVIEDWQSGSIVTQLRNGGRVLNQNPVVFEIGRALALYSLLQINNDNAAAAVAFFRYQSNCYRAAIDQWCLIALRINVKVNKDIRKKVALLVWASRNESLYESGN